MSILDLDEAEGLTAEMVKTWAEARGWRYRTSGLQAPNGGLVTFANPNHANMVAPIVRFIAEREKRSTQDILRDINPRLRAGLPSRAALEAHGETGDWICKRKMLHLVRFCWSVSEYLQMVEGFDVFSTEDRAAEAVLKESSFWPCDANGNKVRWPERDGVML